MSNNNRAYLDMMRTLGIFTGICFAALVILIFTIRLSSNSWQAKLRQNVYDVLQENEPGAWSVGKYIEMNSVFGGEAACFEISGARGTEQMQMYAVIMKVQTLFGPFSAVFTYKDGEDAEFVGFSNLHGRVSEMLKNQKSDTRILYWSRRIPGIMRRSLGENK